MPAISVIVPVYKVEPYLRRCVDSILGQTFTDFELILVDDGSPDNCPAICDEYAAKDPRVVVIHQENGGLSAARNAGIEYACGEYLCFVDSDDILAPDYCKFLYRAAVAQNCKIASCRMERFCGEDFSLESYIGISLSTETIPYTVFLRKQMSREVEIGVCSKLFHRSVFLDTKFMNGKLHEDIIFAGDLLKNINFDVAYIDVPLYYYRQRVDSIVNQQANSAKCSPDRVWAGNYLLECAKKAAYPYLDDCLCYAVSYPWCFVDSIYVHFRFRENRKFLVALQKMIRDNKINYQKLALLPDIQRKRMLLFSRSKILYAFNAYTRLFRVYLYHVIKRDAYADGHGI